MREIPSYWAKPETSRGLAMLIAGAALVVLKWVLPAVAPLAVVAYGLYQATQRRYGEAFAALAVSVALWYGSVIVGVLLWLAGAAFAVAGLFLLIRSWREAT